MYAVIVGMLWALAQPPVDPSELTENDKFWEARQRQQVGAAAELVLSGHPLTIALLRMEAKRLLVWNEPEFASDLAPPLNPAWLDEIVDRTPIPQLAGKLPDENPAGFAFYRALSEAIVNSSQNPVAAFAKSAEENSYVTFGHLYGESWRYRGKAIPVQGVLKRVRKYHAPLLAQKEGITFVYEGWIYGPTAKANPFQVLFTSLPEGLKEAEDMHRQVTFYGYFLKINKYRAGKGEDLMTPYLVGPTVVLSTPPAASPADDTPMSAKAILIVVGIVVAALSVMLAVSWYYRRGDEQFRTRVLNMQVERAMEMMEQTEGQDNVDSRPEPQGGAKLTSDPKEQPPEPYR